MDDKRQADPFYITNASPQPVRAIEQWWLLRAGSVRLSCTLRRDEDLPGVEARIDRNGELVAARLCLSRTAAIAWAESLRVRAIAAGYVAAES